MTGKRYECQVVMEWVVADRVSTLMMGVKGAGKSYVVEVVGDDVWRGDADGQMASKDLMKEFCG